jgi:hypothetical protein
MRRMQQASGVPLVTKDATDAPFFGSPRQWNWVAIRSQSAPSGERGRLFCLRYSGRVGWAICESLADLTGTIHSLRQERADAAFDTVMFQMDEVPAACFASSGVAVQVEVPESLAELPRLA